MEISLDDVVRLLDANPDSPTELLDEELHLYPFQGSKAIDLKNKFVLVYREGSFVEMFADSPPVVEYVHQNMRPKHLSDFILEVCRPVNIDEFSENHKSRPFGIFTGLVNRFYGLIGKPQKELDVIIYQANGEHGQPEYKNVKTNAEYESALRQLSGKGTESLYVFERVSDSEVTKRYYQIDKLLNFGNAIEAKIIIERAMALYHKSPASKETIFMNIMAPETKEKITHARQSAVRPSPEEALPAISELYAQF